MFSAPRSVLLALCSLLLTSTAQAERLLATIVLPGYYSDVAEIGPARMGFGVYDNLGGTGFGRSYNVTEVGTDYEAPTALMAGINAGFDDPQAEIIMNTMSAVGNWDLTRFWELPNYIFPGVPQLGVGLEGYDVSRITQTLDSLSWTPSGSTSNGWNANGQQTIRLYGHAEVPEPATWLFLLCCVVLHVSEWFPCSRYARHHQTCRRP